jgi:regulator of replication initiation timing
MEITNVDTPAGQQASGEEIQVPISGEAVIRQLQRRSAVEVAQLLTENAELRAENEVLRAEYSTWRTRAETFEKIVEELQS